ncbi:MAG: head-tail connector protein [Candidatus Thiodiazotropha sp. 6PLUC6]
MADLLPVSLIRQQLRLERDDEDDYLEQLASGAIDRFQAFTGCTLVSRETPVSQLEEGQVQAWHDIVQGLLMQVAHWYENREMTAEKSLSEIPAASHDLWAPYVIFHLGDTDGYPHA